jgi:DnaA family protein
VLNQLPLKIRLDAELSLANFWFRPALAELRAEIEALATRPTAQLFLWGSSGVGKSHLLQGISERLGPDSRYLPMGDLLDYAPEAVLDGVEDASALLVDDAHVLVGHSAWQEALFHRFNQLRELGIAQIVAASAPPARLDRILPDLRSRWGGMTVYQLPPHDDEALAQLLQFRAQRRGLTFSDEVVAYIMARSTRNAGDLMALLDSLDEASLARGRAITVPLLAELRLWSRDQ